MYKKEFIQENEIHKNIGYILVDHLIQVRWSDLEFITKKKITCHLVDFTLPVDHREKMKETGKKIKSCG